MEKTLKLKLLAYSIITMVTFPYLVLPQNAGVSVPVFIIIQFLCLYFILPRKKPLLLFVPIFILSLNSFIYGDSMWRTSNFIVIILLYVVMILITCGKFKFNDNYLLTKILSRVFSPLEHFNLPFKWVGEINKGNTTLLKRIMIAVFISAPVLLLMIALLVSADIVFKSIIEEMADNLFSLFDGFKANMFFKIIYGIFMGFYAFGLIVYAYKDKLPKKMAAPSIYPDNPYENELYVESKKEPDQLIMSIFLSLVLILYTVFVGIQFTYLFARAGLPYGLNFSEYARKGFFELLFLTGVNIVIILICTNITKDRITKFTKILLGYLCVITFILLISSFYRMMLYNADDGLTRLRFLVFGFLIFEAIGLIFTFLYTMKPRFSITSVYMVIALSYYLILNVIPIDYFVAKSQMDRGTNGALYISTLSSDAAEQVYRLYEQEGFSDIADNYFSRITDNYYEIPSRWQRYNLSFERIRAYDQK